MTSGYHATSPETRNFSCYLVFDSSRVMNNRTKKTCTFRSAIVPSIISRYTIYTHKIIRFRYLNARLRPLVCFARESSHESRAFRNQHRVSGTKGNELVDGIGHWYDSRICIADFDHFRLDRATRFTPFPVFCSNSSNGNEYRTKLR